MAQRKTASDKDSPSLCFQSVDFLKPTRQVPYHAPVQNRRKLRQIISFIIAQDDAFNHSYVRVSGHFSKRTEQLLVC